MQGIGSDLTNQQSPLLHNYPSPSVRPLSVRSLRSRVLDFPPHTMNEQALRHIHRDAGLSNQGIIMGNQYKTEKKGRNYQKRRKEEEKGLHQYHAGN